MMLETVLSESFAVIDFFPVNPYIVQRGISSLEEAKIIANEYLRHKTTNKVSIEVTRRTKKVVLVVHNS
jgi:hypothetical protein